MNPSLEIADKINRRVPKADRPVPQSICAAGGEFSAADTNSLGINGLRLGDRRGTALAKLFRQQPQTTMKTYPEIPQFESTYALILRSEERERTVSETLAYALLILSAVFAVWQIAQQPFTVPTNLTRGAIVSQHAAAPTAQPAV